MCEEALEKNPYQLGDFLSYLKTQEMCIKAAEDEPEILEYVTDHPRQKGVKRQCAENHIPGRMSLIILRHKKYDMVQ